MLLLSPLALALNIEAKEAYSLGLKAKKKEAWSRAEQYFTRAQKLEPSWSKPLEAIIRLRLDGHLPKPPLNAELALFRALEPSSYKFWLFRGRYSHHRGQHQEALESYAKVLEIRPRTLSAMLYRGDLLLHLNSPDRALVDYEAVLKLRSDHAEARWGKLLALIQLEQWTKAHELANELAADEPNNPALWNLRHLASRYSGLPEPAPRPRNTPKYRPLLPSDDVRSSQQ